MNFFEKELKVRLTFTEEILGSSPASQEIYREYIASKAPDAPTIEDEIAAVGVDETADAKMTVFPRQNGVPGVWDYQVKGFFKDSCGGLGRVKRTLSGGLKAYKKVIDKLVFVEERFIPYEFGGKMGVCERPLRAQTAQGERVALSASESIPAGAQIEFTIGLLDAKLEDVVREWLDYGELSGFGQWRSSGKGRFTWEEVK